MDYKEIAAKSVEEVLQKMQSAKIGLSQETANVRLNEYGKNEITSSETSWVTILLRQFKSPFFYLLLAAFVISFFVGEKLDAFMILLFVCINAVLGFFQEYRSEQTVALLKKFIASKVRTLRDGKETLVEAHNLVRGDIILIEPGDIVPGDVRLIDAYDLTINESVLTGESEPKGKGLEVVGEVREVGEAANICFSGTEVSSGKGTGLVFATGKDTNYGDIARLATSTKKESTFEKEIGKLSKFVLVLVAVTLGFVVLTNILVRGHFSPIEFLLFAIALSVSVIPEALPVVTTFSLSIGARRLAKKSVVVKRLSAIEDLGSIEILCSDKTGTLTENKLEVVGVHSENPKEMLTFAHLASTYIPLSRNAGNNAFEEAIIGALDKYDKKKTYKTYKRIHEIPFDPERRRTSALIANRLSQIVISRGAAESVLPLCDMTKREYDEAMEWEKERGLLGIRVLAVAAKKIKKGKDIYIDYRLRGDDEDKNVLEKEEKDLQFLGFISFKDPIKKSTFNALEKAKALGVQVKILTGDSKEVAGAVAKDVGLVGDVGEVVTGSEFEKMTSHDRHSAVMNCHVFARVTPTQKYAIIELLKEHHEVGFLGEGINDAPALKDANVGMVVQSASDVAREAADIVLLDRSLAVIVDGIHEGRNVFANTSKYISTTLSANFGNFFAIAIVSLLIDYLPMLPLQILLVNLLTDFPMIIVATDTVDSSDVATPRKYDLAGFAFLAILLGVVSTFFDFVFFAVFKASGPSVLQTNWFIGSILTELVFIFSLRSRKFFLKAKFPSWPLITLASLAALVAIALPYTAFGHETFKFVSPTRMGIILIIGIVLTYFMTTEIVKLRYYKMTTKSK